MIEAYAIENRLQQLLQRPTTDDTEYLYAQIDQVENDLDTGLFEAENTLTTYPPLPWTLKIYNAHKVYKYWMTAQSLKNHHIAEMDTLNHL